SRPPSAPALCRRGALPILAGEARERDLSRHIDLTFIKEPPRPGTLHPITQTRRELERVFRRLGFDIADGPHVEAELYSFDKLNRSEEHTSELQSRENLVCR